MEFAHQPGFKGDLKKSFNVSLKVAKEHWYGSLDDSKEKDEPSKDSKPETKELLKKVLEKWATKKP